MKQLLAVGTALCLLCAVLLPERAAAREDSGDVSFVQISVIELSGGASASSRFKDVPEDLESAAAYVVDHGLMEETAPGMFSPDKTISRADAVAVLYNLAGRPRARMPRYPDVRRNWWYTKAIGWATHAGLIIGYEDGRFGPMDRITREQLACLLYAYQKRAGYEMRVTDLEGYSDEESVSTNAETAVAWAVGGSVLQTKDGGIHPAEHATRGDMAIAMLALTRGQNRTIRPEAIDSAYAVPYEDGVNLREGPGSWYRVITFCPPYWHLTVLEEQKAWLFVRIPTGETGYVSRWSVGLYQERWEMPEITEVAVPITQEEAAERLEALQEIYCGGLYWNNPDRSVSFDASRNNMDALVSDRGCNHDDSTETCCLHMGICTVPFAHPAATQCLGYVSLLSDLIFGAGAPVRGHRDLENVQVGDIIRLIGSSHAVLVTAILEDGVEVTECNRDFVSCGIQWGWICTWRELEKDEYLILTRYPEPESDGSSEILAAKEAVPLYAAPEDETAADTLWRGEFVYTISRQTEGWYLVARESGEKGYVPAEQMESIYRAT